MALYPWQTKSWAQLIRQQAKLPQSLLITGKSGIGKQQFALYLVQYLLCKKPTLYPCEHCVSCRAVEQQNHPDFLFIRANDKKSEGNINYKKSDPSITLESIRELNAFARISAHQGNARVLLIYPAEAMHVNAANAILKILEEPPEGLIFILISHQWHALLATIRSRCHRFPLPIPDQQQALAWLHSQGIVDAHLPLSHYANAPLNAIGQPESNQIAVKILLDFLSAPQKYHIIQIVKQIEQLNASTASLIDCWQKWIMDCVLCQYIDKLHYYPDYQMQLKKRGPIRTKLWHFYDQLLQARRSAAQPINQRLLLERLLYSWIES